jgi:hypothetical protein
LDALTAENDASTKALVLEHEAALCDAAQQKQTALDALKSEGGTAIEKLNTEHTMAMVDSDSHHRIALDRMLSELKGESQAALDMAHQQHQSALEVLNAHHETALATARFEESAASEQRYQAAMDAQRKSHRLTIEELEAEHSRICATVAENTSATAMHEAEERSAAVSQAQRVHDEAIRALKIEHNNAIETMAAAHAQDTRRAHERLVGTEADSTEKLRSRVDSMVAQHQRDLEQCAATATEVERQHAEKTIMVKADHQRTLNNLTAEAAAQMQAATEQHAQQLMTLSIDMTTLQQSLDDLKKEHAQVLQSTVGAGAVPWQRDIETLKEDHRNTLAALTTARQDADACAAARLRLALATQNEEHQSALLTAQHEAEQNARVELEDMLETVRIGHQREIDDLKGELGVVGEALQDADADIKELVQSAGLQCKYIGSALAPCKKPTKDQLKDCFKVCVGRSGEPQSALLASVPSINDDWPSMMYARDQDGRVFVSSPYECVTAFTVVDERFVLITFETDVGNRATRHLGYAFELQSPAEARQMVSVFRYQTSHLSPPKYRRQLELVQKRPTTNDSGIVSPSAQNAQ